MKTTIEQVQEAYQRILKVTALFGWQSTQAQRAIAHWGKLDKQFLRGK